MSMLTAEQVRECVETVYLEGYSDGSANRGAHVEETDWQAIADELNTVMGDQDAIAFCRRIERAVARCEPLTLFGVDYSATAGDGDARDGLIRDLYDNLWIYKPKCAAAFAERMRELGIEVDE